MLFEIKDKSVSKDVDFLKEFSTLYNLLIYLLGNNKRLTISLEDQLKLLKAVSVLEVTIPSIKNDITDQSEEQKKKILVKQESVLNNAKVLLEERNNLIGQFSKSNKISQDEKFYGFPKKSEENISDKLEEESDQSIPK